ILQPLYDETGRQVGQGPILTSEAYEPATNDWHGYQISFPSQLGQQVVMSAFALPGERVIGLSTSLLAAAGLGLQPGVRRDGFPFLLDPSSAAITIGPAAPQDSGLKATGVLPDGLLVLASASRTLLSA